MEQRKKYEHNVVVAQDNFMDSVRLKTCEQQCEMAAW